MDDDDLLKIVADERRRSVGFDHDATLRSDRERALNYLKGDMSEDLPTLDNRSKAVSLDGADAVETILPDLIEIFTGGEDVATFRPTGPEDEKAAEQETDYINHVVFNENDGFMILYTMFKDAMQVKTGVVKWWPEDIEPPEPKTFTGQPEAAAAQALQDLQMSTGDAKLGPEAIKARPSDQGEGLWDFELPQDGPKKRIRIKAFDPDDFTVAADTVRLSETTYCAMRSRPRAQDLLAQGIDADIVDSLPAYGITDGENDQARDHAGEHDNWSRDGATRELRVVEEIEHYIRLVENGTPQIWRVRTGGGETILIEKEKVDSIPFAAITPFVVTHRFYGESVMDKIMEVQRIKTVLTRAALDSTYFSLNARMEIDESKMGDFTVSDLLDNQPGMPIRVKQAGAVTPISSGGLSFDPFGSLEYFSTVAEQRTGIVRNAQGLNPDTLHDTAKGAMALLGAAQKRIRLIARIFAETGVKDMFLGVHALIRQGGFSKAKARLRNGWADVDPTAWGARNDMSIEIGLGSAGREHDLLMMREIIGLQAQAVQAQGGISGPLVTPENLYASATKLAGRAGIKQPEMFFSDPSKAPPPQQQGPTPEMMAQQAQVQGEQAKLQLEGQKAQVAAQNDQAKQQLAQVQVQIDGNAKAHAQALAERKQQFDEQLALMKLQQERELTLAEIDARYATQTDSARIRAEAEGLRVGADLTITAASHSQSLEQAAHEAQHAQSLMAQEHQHAHEIAAHDHANAMEQQANAPAPSVPEQPDEPPE